MDARLAWPTVDPALTVDSPLTVDPALVVGVAGAVSGSTAGATLTVGATAVVGATLVVVVVGCPPHTLAGPMHVPGGTAGVRTVVDVLDVDDVDVEVEVEVEVVGKSQVCPLSLAVTELLTPSEPVQCVVTVTAPAGRDVENVFVGPVHVNDVTVPLVVTVAELVPVGGNAE